MLDPQSFPESARGRDFQTDGPALNKHPPPPSADPATVSGRSLTDETRHNAFAQRWKFVSYLEMLEASQPVTSIRGKNWWATAVPGGGWILWNDSDLAANETYASAAEAAARLPPFEPRT